MYRNHVGISPPPAISPLPPHLRGVGWAYTQVVRYFQELMECCTIYMQLCFQCIVCEMTKSSADGMLSVRIVAHRRKFIYEMRVSQISSIVEGLVQQSLFSIR